MRQYSSSYIFNEQTPSGQPLLLGSLKGRKLGGSRTSQRVNNQPGVGASAESSGATAALAGPGSPTTTLHLGPPPIPIPSTPTPTPTPFPPDPNLSGRPQRSCQPLFSDSLLCLPSLWRPLTSTRQPALGRERASGLPVSLSPCAARSRPSGWLGPAL